MDLTLIEEIGLTRTEAKCYIALIELGPSRSGEILKKSGLHNSVMFTCLKSLSEKGLVKSINKGKRKEYSAVAPEVLLEILDEKKAKIKSLLPELKRSQLREKQGAEVFYGLKGIKAAHLEQIKDTKAKEEYLFFSRENEYYSDEAKRFLIHFNALRREKGIKVKGIIKANSKSEKIYDDQFRKANILFKKTNQEIPLGIAIFNDSVLQIVWDAEEPVAFLLKSKNLAQQYRSHFNALWRAIKE